MTRDEFYEFMRQSDLWAEEWTICTTLMMSAAIGIVVGFIGSWWIDKNKR